MILDITRFFNEAAPRDYSASVAEIGNNAGADTWRAACDDSADYPLLTTDEQREEFKDTLAQMGFGDTSVYSDAELNALCIQMVASEMRDAFGDAILHPDNRPPLDWHSYQQRVSAGKCCGGIYPEDDGKIYYYMGN